MTTYRASPGQSIKVAHLITDLATGGAEMMLYKLLLSMNDNRKFHHFIISLSDYGTLGYEIQKLGIPVYALNLQRTRPNPLSFWRLVYWLRKEQPDILQTWLYHADLLGLMAAKIAQVPALAWNIRCSDMDLSRYSYLSRLTLKLLVQLSRIPDCVVVNSMAGQRFHSSLGYRPRRWQMIPNGFDVNIFRPDKSARSKLLQESGLPDDSFLIGLIARYDPMKDHRTFLEAAGCLLSIQPNCHFILVGRGVNKENATLSEQIHKLGIEKHTHLLGERSDVPHLMAAMDVVTLCSAFGEGFPNVIGEAMACGIPCVVTDVGDAAAIVSDTGLVVAPGQPQALATAWNKLASLSSSERELVGNRARDRIIEKFSLEAVAKSYEDFYYSLATNHH